jgi:hypothetical protein
MQRCRPVGGGIAPRMSEDECGTCFPVMSAVALHHVIDKSPSSCVTLCDRSVTAIACDEAGMHRQSEVTLVKPPASQSSDVWAASSPKLAECFSQQDDKAADFTFTGARRLSTFRQQGLASPLDNSFNQQHWHAEATIGCTVRQNARMTTRNVDGIDLGVRTARIFCRRLFVGVAPDTDATTAPVRSDVSYYDRDAVHMLNVSHTQWTAIPRDVRHLPT